MKNYFICVEMIQVYGYNFEFEFKYEELDLIRAAVLVEKSFIIFNERDFTLNLIRLEPF